MSSLPLVTYRFLFLGGGFEVLVGKQKWVSRCQGNKERKKEVNEDDDKN
jgi:hypothetical protein